jgi:hypothetical protein
LSQGVIDGIHLLLTVQVDVVGVGDVTPFGAGTGADKAVYRPAFAEHAADVRLALFDGDGGCYDDFDVEVLWEKEFFFLLVHNCGYYYAKIIKNDDERCGLFPFGNNFCRIFASLNKIQGDAEALAID